MKPSLLSLLIAALTLPAASFIAHAADSERARPADSSATSGAAASTPARGVDAAGIGIHGISSGELDHKVTAKKLLELAVYDRAGNKVGDVVDVAMEDVLPPALAQKLASAQQQGWRQAGTSQRTPQANEDANGGTASSGPVHSQSGPTTAQTRSDGNATAGRTASSEDAAAARANDMNASGAGDGSQLLFFVRVGGAFGIGGNTVAIPASHLEFDEENERFTIAQTEEEIAAIVRRSIDASGSAKQAFEDDGTDAADPTDTMPTRADGASPATGATP